MPASHLPLSHHRLLLLLLLVLLLLIMLLIHHVHLAHLRLQRRRPGDEAGSVQSVL